VTSSDISLIGVYDADGTVFGEIRYWVGARLGRVHCSLCEITHGMFREKSEWQECRASLGVSFTTFHRDDAPLEVLTACSRQLPVVVACRGTDFVVVLDSQELERLDGSVEAFRVALFDGCARQGIVLE